MIKLSEKFVCKGRVKPIALGLALAVIGVISVVIMSLWVTVVGSGQEIIELMSKIYFGYSATFIGTIIGSVWTAIDCFVVGILIGYLYNWFAGLRFKKK